ncbi:FHA domain-containing protein [Stigmatella sp. ncwal1]|uniref:FHA domain-containing protein n=1 Tax=Stigmatella ashevillensis TaxID=2995309 RepID=A0ABT5D273_9BACT|nr:FHA domain-containing protein [Stigmatella ashevillena]MDC0707772.1 FHA domain-containing protein [Stigmatella ashevillena]
MDAVTLGAVLNEDVLFLEVLEGDAVQSRHRLERFPVTVGRGYTNDVILDDPKVSTKHLRIERTESGGFLVRDVGSRNGTFRLEPWAPLAELMLTPGARVAVGDTVLRFRGQNHAVETTWVSEAPVVPRRRFFEQPPLFMAALVSALVASALSEYLTSYDKTDWGELVYAVLLPATLSLFWAGAWSIASRIARRQFYFRAHGAIGSLTLLGFVCTPGILTVLGFSLSLGGSIQWLSLLGYSVLLTWCLFWHLRYVTRWDSRRLGAGVGVVVLGFGTLVQAQELLGNEGFSTALDFPRTLLPSSLRLVPASTLEEFFQETADIQEQVDTLAKEE